MENLRRLFSIFEVRGGKIFVNVVWLDVKYDHFFYCKTDNLSCLNKKNCLVNSKVKELFMCFYVICMNKHVGIILSVSLIVLYTGARGTDHPPFSNFLFTNLFSIKFLYFFIISSLFSYLNLFVSIFIQSYANIKLHVSTLSTLLVSIIG